MKVIEVVALGGCLSTLISASVIPENNPTTPSTVSFSIERRLITPEKSVGDKRAPFTMPLINDRYYTHDVKMSLGTPPQELRALLDTGSSGILVLALDSDLCKGKANGLCKENGSYDAKKSKTYKFLDNSMKKSFASFEKTSGDFATDVLQFGNIKIPNMQMGVMKMTNVSQNIFGIGYTAMKNIVEPMTDNTPHENLPSLLLKQKLIESQAFSLWMNDLSQPGGEILFGGIDSGKYTGDLIPIPFVERVKGMVIDFSVSLKKLQITNEKGTIDSLPTKSLPVFALLDSGSSQTILPDDIVDAIYEKIGANVKSAVLPTVKCSMMDSKTTIDFLFDNDLIIKAPVNQFIYPQKNAKECIFWGLGKTSLLSSKTIILGSSFLSSAYVVFDLANKEASMARAKWNPKTSSVLPIKSGAHAVPGITTTWRGVPAVGKTISGWKYLGCSSETEPRTLDEKSYTAPNMSIEACQSFCHNFNYRLAGLEFAQECHCGNALENGGAVGALGCDTKCEGAPEQICGGHSQVSIFEDATYVPATNLPIINHFGYFGCYSELPTGRLLAGPSTSSDFMTAESCTSFCRAQGVSHLWSGLEYGRECYCGSTLSTEAIPAPESSCDMPCSGNNKEYCGGSRKISMYKYIDSA